MNWLFDTNVALYHLSGRLADRLPEGVHFLSVISEMEMLAWDQLDAEGEFVVRSFLTGMRMVELTVPVREQAVRLRRECGLKLPDAIIAASALTVGATLLSTDERLLRTPGIKAASPALKG